MPEPSFKENLKREITGHHAFSAWLKDYIDQYSFIENQDFVVFTEIMDPPQGGRQTAALSRPFGE